MGAYPPDHLRWGRGGDHPMKFFFEGKELKKRVNRLKRKIK
jgi:hypothetical protein